MHATSDPSPTTFPGTSENDADKLGIQHHSQMSQRAGGRSAGTGSQSNKTIELVRDATGASEEEIVATLQASEALGIK